MSEREAEVVSPQAFDSMTFPATVPVTRWIGGPVIPGARADLRLDDRGVVADIYMPADCLAFDFVPRVMSFRVTGEVDTDA